MRTEVASISQVDQMKNPLEFSRRIPAPKAPANDFVGYEVLVDFIKEQSLYKLEGDLVEIGVFMGGGTVKLARFAQKYRKKVYAIDIFDPSADKTENTGGVRMCDIYEAFLEDRSQFQVYRETTHGFDNIVTIKEDSKKVRFPGEQKFMFGFIDGNHHPEYVRNDFHLVWSNLVPNGAIGFHDYNYELPEVTETINSLMAEHVAQISETHEIKQRHIILLIKKGNTALY